MTHDSKKDSILDVQSTTLEKIVLQSKWKVLTAGASAGLVVDSSLYPIDTIKSRLQSKAGFLKSGGFSNLYRGLPPVLIGSIPNSAVFFAVYESVKHKLHDSKQSRSNDFVLNHMIAASLAEIVSCGIRVPYEVIKMRSQTTLKLSNITILKRTISQEGFIGLYRGFSSTLIRDLPFSALQYPIWERLKMNHLNKYRKPANALQSAFYGSIAGAIAAFLTTPLDVAKTRIMIADKSDNLASGKVFQALKEIYKERGAGALFAGVVPRVIWISIGAAIYLGTYEKVMRLNYFD